MTDGDPVVDEGTVLWAGVVAFLSYFDPVVVIDGQEEGRLQGLDVEVLAEDVIRVTARYRSRLQATKEYRIEVSADRLLDEYGSDFSVAADGVVFVSKLPFAIYEAVEGTFGWNLPESEVISDRFE